MSHKNESVEEGEIIDSTEIFGFDSDEEIMIIKSKNKIELNSLEAIPLNDEEIENFLNSDLRFSDSSSDSTEQLPAKRKAESPVNNNKRIKEQKMVECAGTILVADLKGCRIQRNIRQKNVDFLLNEALKLYPTEKRSDAIEMVKAQEISIASKVPSCGSYRNLISSLTRRIRAQIKAGKDKLTEDEVEENPQSTDYKTFRKKIEPHVLSREAMFRNGYPVFDDNNPGHVQFCSSQFVPQFDKDVVKCRRCGTRFDPVKYYSVDHPGEDCVFHPEKRIKTRGSTYAYFTCCNSTDSTSRGCSSARMHVFEGKRDTRGFLRVPDCSGRECECGVYGLDCEMVYTARGVELARVTLIDHNLLTVYDSLVRPESRVVDYNTRFSGIKEEDLNSTTTTLREAQNVVMGLLCRESVLVGHSMENDLICLRICHERVVDTSVLFPHRWGPPYKHALKTLAMSHLNKVIQNDIGGHDSRVDAATCIELVRHKVGL